LLLVLWAQASALLSQHTPLPASASRSFLELLVEFRTGDADRAVAEFARWPAKRVEAEARLSSSCRYFA
jgi:hypothetical protein